MKTTFCIIFFALLTAFSLRGQGNVPVSSSPAMASEGQPCPEPPPPGGESCAASCVYCNLDGYLGINNGTPSGGNTICGQISIHNDQWFGFVAGSDTITFDIVATNCQNGDGLQTAIFGDCADADAIVCNPGCGGCAGQSLSLTYTDYTPGETYWLVIDGWVADVCDFEIDVLEGSATAPPPAPAAQPAGPTQVCPGATAVYSIPDAAGAGFYHWTAPPGASINGSSNNVNINAPQGTHVTITFGAAGGQVCVQTGNTCMPLTSPKCLSVISQAIPATIKPPLEICNEALPFVWDEEPFTLLNTPGTFDLVSSAYDSYLGCDSIVRQTITINPPNITNLPAVTLCAGECFDIAGSTFCDPGLHNVVLDSYRGCDSTIVFTLEYVHPVAEITGQTQILCEQTSATLESAPSQGDKTWKDATGQIIGLGNSITVTQAGIYTLTTTLSDGNLTCEASDTVLVTDSPTQLDVQIIGATEGCTTDSLVLSCVVMAGNAQFEWTGPDGFTASVQNPLVTVPGIYTVSVLIPGGCMGSATATVPATGGTPDVAALNDTLSCIDIAGQLNGSSATNGATFFWTGPGNFQSTQEDPVVFIPGEYLLTVTAPGGCTNTAIAFLLADNVPPTVDVPDYSLICTTYPTLNCVTSALIPVYSWSGPNGFSSGLAQPVATAPGVYTVTVTDAHNGCTATAESVVTEDQTTLQFISSSVVQPVQNQNNGSISIDVLSSAGQLSYSWYLNGTPYATTQNLSNLAPGTYLVVVTDAFGCTAEMTFILEAVSASHDVTDVTPWMLRPNPSTGRFELCCNEVEKRATRILVHDYSGRFISEQAVLESEKEIMVDLTDEPDGVYFLEVRSENRSTWLKVVVQR